MLRKILFITTLFILPFFEEGRAQSVLLDQNVVQDTVSSNFGPGKRHFLHGYMSVGRNFGSPDSTGAALDVLRSGSFDVGLRYKLKIASPWEIGIGLKYNRNAYALKQNDEKVVFGGLKHEKEKLILNDLGGTFFNRFVFGKRGDFIGTFLDIGVFANYSLGKKRLVVDEYENKEFSGAKKVRIKQKGLTYVKDYHYGFLVRIGYNRFALYGRFRYSDLWKEDDHAEKYPELPRMTAGIQVGMHR